MALIFAVCGRAQFNETPLEGCVDKQVDDAAMRAAKEATRALLRSSGKSGAAK